MKMYDFLIVGSGLFGAVFAHEATKKGKKCLCVERRGHIGGNIYTEQVEGINVHKYGAHIFHTDNKRVWDYVNEFAEFNRYTNSPIAVYKDEIYNLPFNMNTFSKLWNIKTPSEAREIIDKQRKILGDKEPANLEEQAISLVGEDIYHKLIEGYTEKQWGRACRELPSFIIKRLPVRFTYDNNYFNDSYQGIPKGGYTKLIERLLEGAELRLNTDFLENRAELMALCDKVVYTGAIDAYYDYVYGELEYRSLRFETEILDIDNFQGNAVVNYTSADIPYTRIIEHKHFEYADTAKTVISREYSTPWNRGDEMFYPINDDKNNALYQKYFELSEKEDKVIFGGRLGMYRYFDMHIVIEKALEYADKYIK